MESIWQKTAQKPQFPVQQQDMQTDVLIVGGGFTGVLCAYFCKQEGIPYILVEKDEIGAHISGHTTAKITVQHGLCYQKIEKSYGKEAARQYYAANRDALETYRQLCKTIDCDFEEQEAVVYARRKPECEKITAEYSLYQTLGIPAKLCDGKGLPFSVLGAVSVKGQAQFHPLKFLYAIARDLEIYENTFVKRFDDTRAYTNRGKIDAKRVVIATHFPFIDRAGLYFMKLYQQRSYVFALENAEPPDAMCIGVPENSLSFRSFQGLLLFGGGGHKTGKSDGGYPVLEKLRRLYYPKSRIQSRWAAQDCMSLDGIPYIGRYARLLPNFYVATGFNKWGMTSSMAAARILTDMLVGRNNENAEVFAPNRSIWKPQLLVNGLNSAGNLLLPLPHRCTHLGCALHYNRQEHSWDCPCHGSRFSESGEILENPANRPLG